MDQKIYLQDVSIDCIQKYLRISKRKRSNDYYACIDHDVLTPAYNYWLNVTPDIKTEVPSLISVNLFSHFIEPDVHRKALEIYPMTIGVRDIDPLLSKALMDVASEILKPIKEISSIEKLARQRDDYRIFSSGSLRVFIMASMRIERGEDVYEATKIEEQYFDQKLKYSERFFEYWKRKKKEV